MDLLNLTLIGMGIATGFVLYWENWTHSIVLLIIYPLIVFCILALKRNETVNSVQALSEMDEQQKIEDSYNLNIAVRNRLLGVNDRQEHERRILTIFSVILQEQKNNYLLEQQLLENAEKLKKTQINNFKKT